MMKPELETPEEWEERVLPRMYKLLDIITRQLKQQQTDAARAALQAAIDDLGALIDQLEDEGIEFEDG